MGCINAKQQKQLKSKVAALMGGEEIIKEEYSPDVKKRLQRFVDKIKNLDMEDANKELIGKGHKYLKQNIRYLRKNGKNASPAAEDIEKCKSRVKRKVEKRGYVDEMAFLDDELEKTGYVYLVPYRRQFRALKRNQGDKQSALESIQGEQNDDSSESDSSGED